VDGKVGKSARRTTRQTVGRAGNDSATGSSVAPNSCNLFRAENSRRSLYDADAMGLSETVLISKMLQTLTRSNVAAALAS